MFGLNVTGKVAPEYVKPVPARVTALTVTAEVPVEVSLTGRVAAVPIGSLPKLKVVVLRASIGFVALVPVPLRVTVLVLPVDELLEMVIVPLAAPVAVGSKLT